MLTNKNKPKHKYAEKDAAIEKKIIIIIKTNKLSYLQMWDYDKRSWESLCDYTDIDYIIIMCDEWIWQINSDN